jgi:hypothetical protein
LYELSVGTDGGPTNSGYVVSSGGSVSVNIGLQGLIAKFSELGTSGTQYPTGSGSRTGDPSDIGSNPLFVVSAKGGVSNPQGQIAPPTGANGLLALDASGGTISGGTCTRADLFGNGIPLGDTTTGASTTFADDGGVFVSGGQYTQLFLQPCGTSGFLPNPSQGFYVAFPNDALAGTYSGLGATSANDTSTAPYFAYVKGSSVAFPGAATGGFATTLSAKNYVSPPTTSLASPHPYPVDPQPLVTPSVTIGASNSVSVLSPLFAAAKGSDATYRDSSNTSGNGAGHAVLNLNGPGSTGTIWAAQFLLPTGSSGYTKSLSSGCTQASPAAVAVQLGSPTTLVPPSGWGVSWSVSAGSLASGGTGSSDGGPMCEVTVSDGFNSVNIWVFNSVARGGGTITIP